MLKFTPHLNETVEEFIFYKGVNDVKNLVESFGSPLSLVFAQNVAQNVEGYKTILNKHHINHKIFYAHKCNKSTAIVKEMLYQKINLDVASENELKHGLACGFTGNQIEATGPKNTRFLMLGLFHNILFNVDNLDELVQLKTLHSKLLLNTKINIVVRLSDFDLQNGQKNKKVSRFGTYHKNIDPVLNFLKQNNDLFNLNGFSFHIDTSSTPEKVAGFENLVQVYVDAINLGFMPTVLNIGGGFSVNYIKDKNEYDSSITTLLNDIVHDKALTWNEFNFGVQVQNKAIKSQMQVPSYLAKVNKHEQLDDFLSYQLKNQQNQTIASFLRDNLIELHIEPGTSLLDQVGISACRVNFVKHNSNNDIVIGIDAKKSDFMIGNQELLIDPIIISNSEKLEKEVGVYFVGNLCMENDIIFKQKVFVNQIPKTGDVLVFANTAGYFMDFNQTNTIMQNIAKKLVVSKNKDGFKISEDDLYLPENLLN